MSGSAGTPNGDQPAQAVRVGHAEREAAAAVLQRHFAEGRLTWDELDERLGAAYAARVQPELDALFSDLPRAAAAPAQIPFAPPIKRPSAELDLPRPVIFAVCFAAVVGAVLLGVFDLAPGIVFLPVLAFVLLRKHQVAQRHTQPSAPRLGNPYAPGGARHHEVHQLRHRHGAPRD
jgi:hypothetical protein